MRATGIVRKIDDLGRIVLPKELRHFKNIEKGDSIEIFVDADLIVLHKYQPALGITIDIERLMENLSEIQEFMSEEELKVVQEALDSLQKLRNILKM